MAGRFVIEDEPTKETAAPPAAAQGRFVIEDAPASPSQEPIIDITAPPMMSVAESMYRGEKYTRKGLNEAIAISKKYDPENTVLPGRMLSEYDVNKGTIDDIGGSIQGAQVLTKAPLDPGNPNNSVALKEYEQGDIVSAFDQAGRSNIAVAQNRPLGEAGDMLATAPRVQMAGPKVGSLARARARMETRGFGHDQSAEAARRHLEPIAPMLDMVNPVTLISNAAETYGAFILGNKQDQQAVLARVAQAVENLPISQAGVHDKAAGMAKQADFDAFMQTYSATTGIRDATVEFEAAVNAFNKAQQAGDAAAMAEARQAVEAASVKKKAFDDTAQGFTQLFKETKPTKQQIDKAIHEMRKAATAEEPVTMEATPGAAAEPAEGLGEPAKTIEEPATGKPAARQQMTERPGTGLKELPAPEPKGELDDLAAQVAEKRKASERWVIEDDTQQGEGGGAQPAKDQGKTVTRDSFTGEEIPAGEQTATRNDATQDLVWAKNKKTGEFNYYHPDEIAKGIAIPKGQEVVSAVDDVTGSEKVNGDAAGSEGAGRAGGKDVQADSGAKADGTGDVPAVSANGVPEVVDDTLPDARKEFAKKHEAATKISLNADKTGVKADHLAAEKAYRDLAKDTSLPESQLDFYQEKADYHAEAADKKPVIDEQVSDSVDVARQKGKEVGSSDRRWMDNNPYDGNVSPEQRKAWQEGHQEGVDSSPADAKSGSAAIGREWDSPYGRQRLKAIDTTGPQPMHVVETVETGEIRNYGPDLESVIKRNEHEITPEYAKEVADRREKAKQIEDRDAQAVERAKQVDAEISGFATAKGMDSLRAGKARAALLKRFNFDGKEMSRKEAIEAKVAAGYLVTSGADGRRLETSDGAGLDEKQLGKTGMDYAEHVIERGKSSQPIAPTPEASDTAKRDEIAQKYAEVLGHKEPNDFHRKFAQSILDRDAAGLKYLSNGLNDTGKKVFAQVTGVKLPRAQGKTWEALQEWAKQPAPEAPAKSPVNSTAPEHANIGVTDEELDKIVADFNQYQKSMVEDPDNIHHLFDPPKKNDVVRLQDKVKVYHAEHGWMTPEEAKAKIQEWKDNAASQGKTGSNRDKVVLSLFDLSGEWSKPWEEAGYQVYRFDIQDDPHLGDVNNFSSDFFKEWFGDFENDVYAILAATPCTDFAVSGARHFAAKDADGRTISSVKLVHMTLATVEYFRPAVWGLENPVGRIEKLGGLPPWRLAFDPNHVGDPYTKKTLLWGRFNADLPIAPVDPVEGSKMWAKYGGKSLATKNARSVTPEGFAYAFFQANNAVDNPVLAIANKYDRLDRGVLEDAVKAGLTAQDIDSLVEDHYYQELDDAAATKTIKDAIAGKTPPDGSKSLIENELAALSDDDISALINDVMVEEGLQTKQQATEQKPKTKRIVSTGTKAAKAKRETSPYGRAGTAAYKHELSVNHMVEDDLQDFKEFFEKQYNAGLNGEPQPRADVHPQQAREYYEAGKKDRQAAENKAAAPKAGSLLADAAAEAGEGFADAFKGLAQAFGVDESKLSTFPPHLDPEAYAKAKPHFENAWEHYRKSGKSLREFVQYLVKQLSGLIKNFADYLSYFLGEMKGTEDFAKDMEARKLKGQEVSDGEIRPAENAGAGERAAVREADQAGIEAAGERNPADGRANPGTDAQGLETAAAENVGETGAAGDNKGTGARPGRTVRRGNKSQPEGGNVPDGRAGTGGEGVVDAGTGGRGDGEAASGGVRPEPNLSRVNFHITDPEALIGGTPKVRFAKNRAAIEALESIVSEGRTPTPEELESMAAYTGWGSFGQELFQGSWDRTFPKQQWEKESQWLKDHLGEQSWKSAQNSILNAHYTDPPTVDAMWKIAQALGFPGGRILEPSMGIGNFFGLMPREIMAKSQLAGIELDKTTGSMAQLLYPDANIQIKGYQESKTSDGFYDLVIGNWPFAKDGPADRRYRQLNPSLHDYFFLKALDQTRAGGLVIGVTSSGTMDKVGKLSRLEMAKKADLVAAFRLPSGAFEKYAGTSVVTDIIILKKRATPNADPATTGWIEVSEREMENGKINTNEYWDKHPDYILGKMDFGHGTTRGRAGMIVNRPENYAELLEKLPSRVPTGVYDPREQTKKVISYITNNTADRQQSVTFGPDGSLHVVQGEYLAPLHEIAPYKVKSAKETLKREEQIKNLVGIRKAYGTLIDAERSGEGADAARKALKTLYDSFVKKHGLINESQGLTVIRRAGDPYYADLASLEVNERTPNGYVYRPAKILTESTVRGSVTIENPSVKDAYVLARNESLDIDIDRIAELAKQPVEAVKKELLESGSIYQTPTGGFEVSDQYLAGNVRRKLREAEAAQESGMDLARNIEALKKLIPADLPYYKIEAKFGAPWISADHYGGYVAELLGERDASDIEVMFHLGRWKVKFKNGYLNSKPEAREVHGHWGVRFNKLVEAAMNNSAVTVRTRDMDGNLVVDDTATSEANAKASQLRENFSDWIWKDAGRKIALEKEYNEVMNAIADTFYDGSFLTFAGMALTRGDSQFSLRQHQVNAVWRGIVNRGGLYAHEVGTGKTYTMGGLAVESRRYGVAKKPLIFAHNANSASVSREIQEMYPAAKVLYIDNLAPESIDRTMRQIANDDWDAVVVPHSLISRFGLTRETLNALAAEEIAAMEQEAIEAAEDDGFSLSVADMNDEEAMKKVRSATAKDLVRARNKIIKKIDEMAMSASKENAIPFEQLGVDMIIVDEAHEFKKPPIATKMRMKGLNTGTSDQSLALHLLTGYVKTLNAGKGVHLFTGTPITNTLTEIYHMMRYVMDGDMERNGIKAWDAWFNTFADSISDVELSAAGDYEAVTRLAAFVNTPELRRMMGQYTDIVFADDMPEFKPRETESGKTLQSPDLTDAERDFLTNGRSENPIGRPYKKVIVDVSPMVPQQKVILEELQALANLFRNSTKKERREMMLAGHPASPVLVETAAGNAGMDVRLVNMDAVDDPNSKVNKAVGNILKIYHEHAETTQVVFMERGFSDKSVSVKTVDGVKIKTVKDRFNLAADIVKKLNEGGIPPEQIAIVDGKVSKERRKEIADAMNRNEIRVVIGNTKTLGVGVNMQVNLRAMHHLDAPWMPGELEQRNGRGWRQGNKWNTVLEIRYVTERLDGRRWQVLVVKDRFIKAFLKSKDDVRVIEGDAVDETDSVMGDLSETLSEAAGDPRILLREKYKKEVERLQNRERMHTFGAHDAGVSANRNEGYIEADKAKVELLDKVIDYYNQNSETFKAKIGGKEYTSRGEAQDALDESLLKLARISEMEKIGEIYGFDIRAKWSNLNEKYDINLRMPSIAGPDQAVRFVNNRLEAKPSIASIEGVLRNLKKHSESLLNEIESMTESVKALRKASQEPFPRAADLAKKQQMLNDLMLDLENNPVPPPSWLRHGAPVGGEVYVDRKPYPVVGHKWDSSGYFVTVDKGGHNEQVPYLDVKDENGSPVYEEHEFEAPAVNGPGGAVTAQGQPAAPQASSAPALELTGHKYGEIDPHEWLTKLMVKMGEPGKVIDHAIDGTAAFDVVLHPEIFDDFVAEAENRGFYLAEYDDAKPEVTTFVYEKDMPQPEHSQITFDMLGMQQAYEALGKIAKAGKEALPHLEAIGRAAFAEGARSWQDFARSMKEKLGDLWQRFKGMVETVYTRLKTKLKEERGSFSMVDKEVKKELAKRYNEFLDRAETAIANRNEAAALRWMAKADEIAAMMEPQRGPAITLEGVQREQVTEPVGEKGRGPAPTEEKAAPAAKPEVAEPPRAPEGSEGRTTGIKNAVTEEEREAQGKDEVEVETRRTFGDAFDRGKALVDSGEIDPRLMAASLSKNPRALSAEESVALIYDRMRLQNDHATVMARIEKATEAGDEVALLENRERLAKIEDDITVNDEAARRTGYEQGLGLAARKMMIAEDYSLARSIQRMKIAIGKPEIPDEVRAKIEELTKKLQEALDASKKYEERIAELEAQKAVKKYVRTRAGADVEVPRQRRKRERTENKAELETEFRSLASKLRSLVAPTRLTMNFDPEAVVVLAEMARNRVIAGITDAKAIIDDIYEELQDLPDLDKRDIRDALSGYGHTYQLSQDEIDKAMREARRQMRLISALEDAESGTLPARSGMQRDPVSEEVRHLQKEVKEAMRESGIDSTSTRTPEQQWKTSLDAAKTRLRNQIRDIERELATGEKAGKKKIGIKYDEEANALKAERDRLKAALEKVEGKQQMSDEQRVKVAMNAVQKSIHEYERRLAEHDLSPRPKGTPTPETPELARLRARRDALAKAYKEMQKDAQPPKDPMEAALKAYKARTMKRLDELQTMLDTGNFDKRAKRVLNMDPEALRLKNQVEKLKEQVDNEIAKQKLANRGALDKTLDFAVKWRRAVILSSVMTVGKLSAAATMRQITTPIEELIGGVLTHLPWFSRIADKAPREGGGINARAESAAFMEWFKTATWEDAWDVAKTGRGELDRRYAHKRDLPPEVIEIFGRWHGALKNTPKRAEFQRALQKRVEWAINHGVDLSDPLTQATLEADAYVDATRAIFMQDNFAVKGYRLMINYFRTQGPAGAVTSTAAQMLIPIVKIPTNFVAELTSYVFGAAKGGARVAFSKGIENLTAEQADYVFRAFKKQGLGMAMLVLGYFLYESIGGYYEQGDKRKMSEVQPGLLRVGGANVPRWMLHTPALEVLQVGATLHRVQNHYAEKGKKGGTAAGVFAGMKGMAEEVPFFEQPIRMGEATRTADSAAQWGSELVESMLVPPDVRRISKATDKAGDMQIPREQKNLWQVLLADVPGQRKNLPLDMKKVERMQLDKLAEIMEHAPSNVVEQIRPEFRKKFARAKGLEPDERDRYRELLKSE